MKEAGHAHQLIEEIAEEASVEIIVEENLETVALYESQNLPNLPPNLIAKEEDLLLIVLEEVVVEVVVPQAAVVSMLEEEGDAILRVEVVLLPILEEGQEATVDPVEVHTVHHADRQDLPLIAQSLALDLLQNPMTESGLHHHLRLIRKMRKTEILTHYELIICS